MNQRPLLYFISSAGARCPGATCSANVSCLPVKTSNIARNVTESLYILALQVAPEFFASAQVSLIQSAPEMFVNVTVPLGTGLSTKEQSRSLIHSSTFKRTRSLINSITLKEIALPLIIWLSFGNKAFYGY